MKQYVITGIDYTDEGALERRLSIRPDHLNGAKKLKENGNYIIGGAMLNDEGKMIGSTMILQFETDAELENWKASEPYLTKKIWEKVEIKPFKVADV
jgi:uncharacterized protein YciI